MAALIFDFDGTIADSFETVIRIFYELTKRKDPISDAEIFRLRQLPLKDILKELNIPLIKIPFLLYRGRKIMGKRITDVAPFPGIPAVIKELDSAGHELFIMSSNSTVNIKKFLDHYHLDGYFKDVHGGVGLLSKASALRKVKHRFGLDDRPVLYVGDEARDVEGCKQAGVDCVAVSWGYNAADLLRRTNPYALVTSPKELKIVLEDYDQKAAN